jgi:hypothetical protein
MTVTLYFGNSALGSDIDCSKVFAVHRTIPAVPDVATATMTELFKGTTPGESAQGYTSWFSAATANTLISIKKTGSTAYINLASDVPVLIPNASASCGSAAYLASMGTTAQQATMTRRVLYALNGKPAPFWEWLQRGCGKDNDQCDPKPFA